MAQVTLKNPAGEDAGTVELDDAMFAIQPNVPVMHQVVVAQLARRRAGTQSTKTRSEVRGGGAKPYRQKGTGNARQGSIRAPHYSGGGIALGPKPRKYGQRTPKKMIRLALRSALSDRAGEGKVLVVDDWGFDAPKTRDAVAALAALGLDGRVLVVIDRNDAATALSFRNLPEVQLIAPGELNAYDVLCNDWVVFTSSNLPTDARAKRLDADDDDDDDASTDEVTAAPTVHAEAPAEGSDDAVDEPVAADEDTVAVSGDTEAEAAPTIQGFAAMADERFGAGSHVALEDDSQPEGFDIKGNANSMLYHVPGSAFYDRTIAEVWFASTDAAESAGFALPPSQRDDEEGES